MIPENHKKLIDMLKAKTASNQALWTTTSRDDQYKLDIGKGAIVVSNDSIFEVISLIIYNERGDTIDSFNAYKSQNQDDFQYIEELFNVARRSYYKVDETLEAIFKELESDKVVGIDDLPF